MQLRLTPSQRATTILLPHQRLAVLNEPRYGRNLKTHFSPEIASSKLVVARASTHVFWRNAALRWLPVIALLKCSTWPFEESGKMEEIVLCARTCWPPKT